VSPVGDRLSVAKAILRIGFVLLQYPLNWFNLSKAMTRGHSPAETLARASRGYRSKPGLRGSCALPYFKGRSITNVTRY